MLGAHIDQQMDGPRNRNVFGAFALMVSDDIVRATTSQAPEAGPAASALALMAHRPGLSIRTLAAGVGLSHAGAVRLIDRLTVEGLVERRGGSEDARTRSLFLTATGEIASKEVLHARDEAIAEGLSMLSAKEMQFLTRIAERALQARMDSLDQSYRICRLCCYDVCDECPVDAELIRKGLWAALPPGTDQVAD